MGKPIYKATIYGDSPLWARAKRDCLKRHFEKKGIVARVTAVGPNVRVGLGVISRATSGSKTVWQMLSDDMTRAERACKI